MGVDGSTRMDGPLPAAEVTADGSGRRQDPARLAAVQATGLLDADPEPAFDRLTRLAVAVLGVPAAFLSLVDEYRDFYMAGTGLPEPLATSRELTGTTFCHFAIEGDVPLVIPDTAADPVYREVPTVRTLGVAAYVGVPLIVDSHVIGSFCAIDTVPHRWTDAEVGVLTELADTALREVALRRANTMLERRAAELDHANQQLRQQAMELEIQALELESLSGELEVERARLADVFRQAPAFLAILRGPQHVFSVVNDAYRQLVGDRDLIGKPALEALPEVREQGFAELLDGVLETGEPFVGRAMPARIARTPDAPAEERFIDLTYLPLVDATGARIGVIAHGNDVTEQVMARREVERLLGESEAARGDAEAARAEVDAERQLLSLILDRLPVGVVVVDSTAAVVHLNPACDEVLGASLKPVAALDDYPTYGGGLHPDGTPYAAEDYPIARAVLHGEVVNQELTRYRRGDGRVVMTLISAAPVRDADGRITYAVAAVEDVSALEAARAEAQAANRAKGDFLAVMSHELRTPLNAIGGYAELLEMGVRGPVTDGQREDLHRIQRSQRHLLGLVNEVLNYAKLETGTVHFETVAVAVRAAVAEAEGLVSPQAQVRNLTLAMGDFPPDLAVKADPEKLRQVLTNLLSNAVKFTDPGGHISVSCDADAERVHIAIRDDGIGIHPEKLELVFEPFVQVRADLTRPQEGTGLGLAISRDLARGMGGDLVVQSKVGKGSTFTITLPRCALSG